MGMSARSPDGSRSRATTDPRAVLETLLGPGDEQPDFANNDLRRSLVAGLADENPTVRFSSFWSIRLLADEQPDALPGFVAYLAVNRQASADVKSALVYLDTHYRERVRPELDERGIDPDALWERGHQLVPPSVDDDAEAVTDHLRQFRHVIETAGDVPTVIQRDMSDPEADGEPPLPVVYDDDAAADRDEDSAAEPASEDDTASGDDDTEYTSRRRPRTVVQQKRTEIEGIESSDLFAAIRSQCQFDDLEVVLPRDGRRYADAIRVRALDEGEETGVTVRLLDRPGGDVTATELDGYTEDIGAKLARWQGTSTPEGVVTVHDWAREPRPWLITEPAEETIEEWEPPNMGARLRCGLALVESLATCHQQGVIHGGIDPRNVIVPTHELTLEIHPRLDNVALMLVFGDFFEPTDYLDPRYAAPEYFDADYGAVDQATDIYQLGGVLYRLFTGESPFEGDDDEIQATVLGTEPPVPTAHNHALPDGIDDVVRKAMAKQKLGRYETASQLHHELEAVCAAAGWSR